MRFSRLLSPAYLRGLWAAATATVAICFASCLSAHDSVVADVNPAGWNAPLELVYENRDTSTVKEAALLIRYGGGARGGVYVVELRAPSGARTRDTLDAGVTPRKPSNNLRELLVPYRRGIRFAEAGGYVFTITPPPGTRGVWSAGIDFKNTGMRDGQE